MATLSASDHVSAVVTFADAYGNAVAAPTLVGPVVWASSNTDVTVTSDGSLVADVSPTGPLVTGATVTATYDVGAGAVVVTSEAIDVVAGVVHAAAITFGAPVAK